MQTIEIDFDVFKKLTSMRQHEEDSYNDLLRLLLKLPPRNKEPATEPLRDWACRGGTLRIGTRLRARYQGRTFHAAVTDQGIEYQGRHYGSPSKAAYAVTSTNVNGWRFWHGQLPGSTSWRELNELRREQ